MSKLKKEVLRIKNVHNTYVTIGASNHSADERQQNDYYATDPKAIPLLLEQEAFTKDILEPACGQGHISKALIAAGYNVTSTDLIDRGYGTKKDFFTYTNWDADIITNPPYKIALPFLKHSLEIIKPGNKIALFLRLLFLEGKERGLYFKDHPPKNIYVCSGRLKCFKNGDFNNYKASSSAIAYAWFVWEKGYKGQTIVKWINL